MISITSLHRMKFEFILRNDGIKFSSESDMFFESVLVCGLVRVVCTYVRLNNNLEFLGYFDSGFLNNKNESSI